MENTKPYSAITAYYDKMMDHVDYEMWAQYLISLFRHYQIKPRQIIDLSCGTGSLIKNMDKKRWRLYGSDLSTDMVRMANGRTSLALTAADLKHLPYKTSVFDVTLVMYDTMNYILRRKNVNKVFNQIFRILKPGGWLIFDVVTPHVCEKNFRDYFESDLDNTIGYERRSWFISEGNKQFTEFTIWNGTDKKVELHEQKIRALDEWQDIVEQSPLELIDSLEDFTFHRGHEQSDRVHFICRKCF